MLIRQLIVAALAASACAAHADVVPGASSAAGNSSGILSGWTGANGTDVLSSGVLSGNLSLVGGISYAEASKASGAAGSATLADVLYGKASASVAQTADGKTQLFYQQGIEGMYLLGAGHGILAAMLGNGVSVVGSAGGVIVSQGVGGTGGGGNTSVGGVGAAIGGGGGGSTSGSGGGDTGSGGSGGSYAGGGTTGSSGGSTGIPAGGSIAGDLGGGTNTGGNTGSGGDSGSGGGTGNVVSVPAVIPPVSLDQVPADTPNGSVPEPSSIALMMAGLFGASRLVRRRRG